MIRTVKHGGNKVFGLCLSALLGVSTFALTSLGATQNPYSAIVGRNVFGLHPPPQIIDVTTVNWPPPPKILLTGITTILGKKVAFLTTPSSKAGMPPDSEMLAEGQALDGVEVKIIDEKAGVVVVENHGERQTLDFDHDGSKPSAPNILTTSQTANVIQALHSLPPPNNFGGYKGSAASPNGSGQNQAPLSPEEQVALIELQRAKAIQQADPTGKLYPPTPLTSEITGEPPPAPAIPQ